MTQTTKTAKSVSEHIRTLYQRLMDLDARVAKFESRPERDHAPDVPLALIPLRSETESIGIIAIWQLLPHKSGFTPVDHQLLELVAERAPTALKSAHLHQKSRGARAAKAD